MCSQHSKWKILCVFYDLAMMKLFKVSKNLAGQGKDIQSSVFVLLYVRFCLLFDLHIFVLRKVRKCKFIIIFLIF